jgi:lipoprotein-releasing system permease protein
MIVARYLRPRKGEGFIFVVALFSLIGIALGVAALIVVMSVMNGFRDELLDKILGVNGHAVIQGYDGRLQGWDALMKEARATPGVISATPLIEQQLMVSIKNRAAGAIVRGVLPEDVRQQKIIAQNVLEGSFADFKGDEPVAAIGSRLAQQIFARVGDRITLIAPEGQVTPFGTTPRIVSYRVIAIFEVGIYDYDNLFILLPLKTAQTFFDMGDGVGTVEITTRDPDQVREILQPLQKKVLPVGVITTWKDVNRALFEALEVERVVMFFILTIIIIVAAFNIISSLIMLVRAKHKDIAILRTMGASRTSVLRIFMGTGTLIGAAGTALGVALGLLIAPNVRAIQELISRTTGADLWDPTVRFLSTLPSRVDPGQVTSVALLALFLTVLATLFPSWRAANTDPVQVLRYE